MQGKCVDQNGNAYNSCVTPFDSVGGNAAGCGSFCLGWDDPSFVGFELNNVNRTIGAIHPVCSCLFSGSLLEHINSTESPLLECFGSIHNSGKGPAKGNGSTGWMCYPVKKDDFF